MRNDKKLLSTIMASAIALSLVGVTFAEEYIQNNPYLRRYECYDETGKLKGYGKENTSLKQFELYDGQGKRAGFMKTNSYLDRLEIRDK